MVRGVHWDATVFQPVSGEESCLDLVHTLDGSYLTVKKGNSRISDLSQVVRASTKLLEEGSKKPFQEKVPLFLHLHHLSQEVKQFNREVRETLWITVVHVILAVLTLGLFSFRRAMQIENLPLQLEKLLGVKDIEETLRKAITFKDLYCFPVGERESLARSLGCEERYKGKKEVLDQVAKEPGLAHVMREPLAALDLGYIANDHLAFATRFFTDKEALRKEVSETWSLYEVVNHFGVGEGRALWSQLFPKPQKGLIAFLVEKGERLKATPSELLSLIIPICTKDDWKALNRQTILSFIAQGDLSLSSITEEEFLGLPVVKMLIKQICSANKQSKQEQPLPEKWSFAELKKWAQLFRFRLEIISSAATPQKSTEKLDLNKTPSTPSRNSRSGSTDKKTSSEADFSDEEEGLEILTNYLFPEPARNQEQTPGGPSRRSSPPGSNKDFSSDLSEEDMMREPYNSFNMSAMYTTEDWTRMLPKIGLPILLLCFKKPGEHKHLPEQLYKQRLQAAISETFPTFEFPAHIASARDINELNSRIADAVVANFDSLTPAEFKEFLELFWTDLPDLARRVVEERWSDLGAKSKEQAEEDFLNRSVTDGLSFLKDLATPVKKVAEPPKQQVVHDFNTSVTSQLYDDPFANRRDGGSSSFSSVKVSVLDETVTPIRVSSEPITPLAPSLGELLFEQKNGTPFKTAFPTFADIDIPFDKTKEDLQAWLRAIFKNNLPHMPLLELQKFFAEPLFMAQMGDLVPPVLDKRWQEFVLEPKQKEEAVFKAFVAQFGAAYLTKFAEGLNEKQKKWYSY